MSGANACLCKPRNVEILDYKQRCSAFDGYRTMPSDYSCVRCLDCGAVWRTKAKWVDDFHFNRVPEVPRV